MQKKIYFWYIFALFLFVDGFPSAEDHRLESYSELHRQLLQLSSEIEKLDHVINTQTNYFHISPEEEKYSLTGIMAPGLTASVLDQYDSNECICKSDFFEKDKKRQRVIGTECLIDFNCAIDNSICKGYSCECSKGFYHSLDRKKCLVMAKSLNDTCEDNRGCRKLKYSECSVDKTCQCKLDYVNVDGECKATLNQECDDEFDCAIKGSKCESSVCRCGNDKYSSSDRSQCYQFAEGPEDFCKDNRGCHNVKYSSCSGNNTCECEKDYQKQGMLCLGLINAFCDRSEECAVENSICSAEGICQCSPGYYHKNGHCHKFAERLNDPCDTKRTCGHLKYTECSSDNTCVCLANYEGSTGVCLRLINASCKNSEECAVKAICSSDGKCQCSSDHYLEQNRCHEFAKKPHVPVFSAKACQHLGNTSFTNNQCECSNGFYFDADHCFKIPSGPEIPVDTRKACEYLTYSYYADGICHLYAKRLHESCHAPSGCMTPFSECVSGTCQCKQNYIEHNNVCYGLLNAKCSKPSDCLSTSYSCQSGTCQMVEYERDGIILSSKPGVSSYWISQDRTSPADGGVYAGRDSWRKVFVCRGVHKGLTIPGKLLKSSTDVPWCNFSYRSEEICLNDYQMLRGYNVEWTNSAYTLDKAVYGGASSDDKPYLICRVKHSKAEYQTIVGKLQAPLYDSCIVPFSHVVFNYYTFDILIHR